jgi:hypothetical protein
VFYDVGPTGVTSMDAAPTWSDQAPPPASLQLFFEVMATTLVHRRSTLLLPQEGHLTFFELNRAIGTTTSNGLLHLRHENS